MRREERRRSAVAATLVSIILFTTLLVASSSLYVGSEDALVGAQTAHTMSRISAMEPILVGEEALTLITQTRSYLASHAPSNCTSKVSVDTYLEGIDISNTSAGELPHGISYRLVASGRFASTAPLVQALDPSDDFAAVLGTVYNGYSQDNNNNNNASLNLSMAVDVNISGGGGAVGLVRHEVHEVHIPNALLSLCYAGGLVRDPSRIPHGTVGLLVPLYSYPGPEVAEGGPLSQQWASLVAARAAHPSVPVAAIVNPSSGPGTAFDPNFVDGIRLLQSAGVTVLGYVDAAYGAARLDSVESQILQYSSWYHVDGIFIDDELSLPEDGGGSYYSALTGYAHSLGGMWTMGNPGSATPPTLTDSVDETVIYEGPGLMSPVEVQPNATGEALIAYGVQSLPPVDYLSGLAGRGIGWVWITDRGATYNDLPSYLGAEIEELAQVAGAANAQAAG